MPGAITKMIYFLFYTTFSLAFQFLERKHVCINI